MCCTYWERAVGTQHCLRMTADGRLFTVLLGLTIISFTWQTQVSSHYKPYPHKQPLNYHRGPFRQPSHFRRPQPNQSQHTVPAFKPLRLNQLPNFVDKYSYIPLTDGKNRERPYLHKHNYETPKLISTKLNQTINLERKKETFENFVTPKEENLLGKRYEVTTEKFEDTEPDRFPQVSDGDLTIAIDDEDEGEFEAEGQEEYKLPFGQVENHSDAGNQRPVDSYGRPYGLEGDVEDGSPASGYGRPYEQADELGDPRQGYSYGVVHTRNGKQQPRRRKKPAGRVRMQVFRGPTRYAGHRRYAQWGFYVVQPAVKESSHSHPSYHR